MRLYTYKAVDSFVHERLAPKGYDIHVVPGVLADGYICVAPDENKYHFIMRERYLNEWSSGMSMRRYRRLPKWAVDYIRNESKED